MARDGDMFETTLGIAGEAMGKAQLAALTASTNYAILVSNVTALARGEDAGRAAATRILELLLPRIGLLLDAPGARVLLDQIAAWGLSPADPRLDMLHLNAALETAP
jgi:hypothetical protein